MDDLEKQPNETKPMDGYKIILINILVLVFYTILLKLSGEGGLFGYALLILFHSIFCFACSNNKPFGKYWALSGVLVMIIGISTCARLHL